MCKILSLEKTELSNSNKSWSIFKDCKNMVPRTFFLIIQLSGLQKSEISRTSVLRMTPMLHCFKLGLDFPLPKKFEWWSKTYRCIPKNVWRWMTFMDPFSS